MKKLIINIFLLLFPLLIILPLTNYYVDPAHLFSNEYYNQAANILKNNDVILDDNYNEQRLLKEFVSLKSKVNVIILGSSRSLILDESHVQDNLVLNLSTSGADIEDLIANFGLYKHYHGLPKKVFLNFDTWMLNENRISTRFHGLSEHYNAMTDVLNLETVEISSFIDPNLYELFSLSYFQSSAHQLIKNRLRKNKPEKFDSNVATNKKVKKSNGSIIYPTNWQSELHLVEIAAKRYILEEVYGMNNYNELSQKRIDLFEKFIGYLISNQIEIEIFLSPYHPIVWEYFKKNTKYNVVMESEEFIRELGTNRNISVTGSFSPYNLGLKSKDFYDGMHPRPKPLQKAIHKQTKPKLH